MKYEVGAPAGDEGGVSRHVSRALEKISRRQMTELHGTADDVEIGLAEPAAGGQIVAKDAEGGL